MHMKNGLNSRRDAGTGDGVSFEGKQVRFLDGRQTELTLISSGE